MRRVEGASFGEVSNAKADVCLLPRGPLSHLTTSDSPPISTSTIVGALCVHAMSIEIWIDQVSSTQQNKYLIIRRSPLCSAST